MQNTQHSKPYEDVQTAPRSLFQPKFKGVQSSKLTMLGDQEYCDVNGGKETLGNGANPIALVTGANKGIGKEIARQLSAKGVLVLMGARDRKRGEEAADQQPEIGGFSSDSLKKSLRERFMALTCGPHEVCELGFLMQAAE